MIYRHFEKTMVFTIHSAKSQRYGINKKTFIFILFIKVQVPNYQCKTILLAM